MDSLARVDCSFGISTLAGAFKAGTCDLVTLFESVNASGNYWAIFWKWISLWTSCLDWFVWGSKWFKDDTFHVSFFFSSSRFSLPNARNIGSFNWQSVKRAVKRSPVRGSRYFIMDEDSKPTYIPNLLCGPIFVRCGRAIGTYTAQPNIFKLDIFGPWPKTNCKEENLW